MTLHQVYLISTEDSLQVEHIEKGMLRTIVLESLVQIVSEYSYDTLR